MLSTCILPLPPLGANCYLVENEPRCVIVDPGNSGEHITEVCNQLDIIPEAVLLTHGHFDHVGGVAGLAWWGDLPVYCHAADVSDAPGDFTWMKTPAWKPLTDGQILDLAGLKIKVLHTPGHSPGSCCFLVEDRLFCGDVLFRSSIGRTDLPGGDDGQMKESLKRLTALPGDYQVYPGHGNPTNLGRERAEHPYLRGLA